MADAELFAELPDGWQVKRLVDLASLQSGGTPSKQRPDFWQGAIPWASPKDMKRPYLFDAEDHISEEGLADGSRRVPAGSLFIVVRGMILERDIPIAMAAVPMAFNQDMKAIVPNSQVDGNFMLFALRQFREQLRKEVGSSAHGTKRIGTSAIEGFRLPLPPLPEQRAIAHVLRAAQRAKEAAEAVVASARQLKRSLLRHLFTYGPVPVAEADRVPLKETNYGTHPADWASMPLSACAIVQTGVAKGRKFENEEMVSMPYLRVANVQDGYLDLAEIKHIEIRRSEVGRYSLQPGDVVLTEGGDFDKLGRGFLWNGQVPECVHQNHVFAVRADRTRLQPEYLSYLTQSEYGKSYFLSVAHKTTNLACINTAKLKALPVLVPPLPIQKRIIESLAGVNQKLAVEQARVSALGELFRSLLRDLMTGRVRVHELGLVPAHSSSSGG